MVLVSVICYIFVRVVPLSQPSSRDLVYPSCDVHVPGKQINQSIKKYYVIIRKITWVGLAAEVSISFMHTFVFNKNSGV